MIIDEEGRVLYIKSIHSEDISLWQYGHYNISKTSSSSMMAILLATHLYNSNATTQISSLS